MEIAIVGYTGLVGGHLLRAFPNAKTFNRVNVGELRNSKFDLLFLSALPAEKWRANKHPEDDLMNLLALEKSLDGVEAEKVVLLSTVDVFENPENVDEESEVPENSQAYGRHRRDLEIFVESTFENVWIIRLPGLVSFDIKKNVLFDLKNKKSEIALPINSRFQFYPLSRLAADLDETLKLSPGIFHYSVAPISMEEICSDLGLEETIFQPSSPTAANYNFKSLMKAAKPLGYLVSKEESLQGIRKYLANV